jgi:hypothetical protein
MTRAMQGVAAIMATLAAATPLHAQTASSVSGDTDGHKTGSHEHGKHGGGKHGTGHKWLAFDAATNTVTFKLVAGRDRGESRLNFNGYTDGKASLVVPPKSAIVMNFVNQDSLPHSAVIIAGGGPIPATVDRPAIPGAATTDLASGLPGHGTDQVRFTAPASGSYRIASGVPGQARSGMWIRFTVDPTAKAPAWRKNW